MTPRLSAFVPLERLRQAKQLCEDYYRQCMVSAPHNPNCSITSSRHLSLFHPDCKVFYVYHSLLASQQESSVMLLNRMYIKMENGSPLPHAIQKWLQNIPVTNSSSGDYVIWSQSVRSNNQGDSAIFFFYMYYDFVLHVLSTYMEEAGFMTYTVANHQGTIETDWLNFWGSVNSQRNLLRQMFHQHQPGNQDLNYTYTNPSWRSQLSHSSPRRVWGPADNVWLAADVRSAWRSIWALPGTDEEK